MPPESRSAHSKTVSHLTALSNQKFLIQLSVCWSISILIPYDMSYERLWLPLHAGLEELWFGATFDPVEKILSWEPVCPVTAVVTLCQKKEEGVCVDLPHASQNVSRGKVQAFHALKQLLCLLCKVSGYWWFSPITVSPHVSQQYTWLIDTRYDRNAPQA